MKALKIVLGVIALVVVGVIAAASMQSTEMKVERSVLVTVSPETAYHYISDMNHWKQWSPWQDKDPNMNQEVTGDPGTVGHKLTWNGNDQVGSGEMTISKLENNKRIGWDLHFITPWEGRAGSAIILEPNDKQTQISWTMDSQRTFGEKVFGLFMDMEQMIGADYEKGLESLKEILESEERRLMDKVAENKEGFIGMPKGMAEQGIQFKPQYDLLPKELKAEIQEKLEARAAAQAAQ